MARARRSRRSRRARPEAVELAPEEAPPPGAEAGGEAEGESEDEAEGESEGESEGEAGGEAGGDPVCALCLRPIPRGVPQSLHHLVPKLKGGTHGPTVLLHHLCHKEIHAALSEAELARDFATPERLRAHPRLARFAAWVGKRPPSFLSRVPKRGRR